MWNRRGLIALIIVLAVSLGAWAQSEPEETAIALRFFTVEAVQDREIHVDFGIGVSNVRGLQALLRDGAVMHLDCRIRVERVRTLLTNKVLADKTQVYQMRHDPLTRDFIVAISGEMAQRSRKFGELLESVLETIPFDIPMSDPLVRGQTYRVRLDVTLQHAEVPPWLEKALFFWSWDVAPSLSFSQEFVY